MTTLASDLPSRLRTETRDLHDAAENHRFQRALVTGELEKVIYVRWLEQMLVVHRALDAAISVARPSHGAFGIVTERQMQTPYLEADLLHFGSEIDEIETVPATRAFVALIERTARERPLGLFGIHYVLEGSNNGSRFIAKALRRVYGLTPGLGDRYLDPYGTEQGALWAEFKRGMGELDVTTDEADLLVEAARATFGAVTDIGEDLLVEAGDAAPEASGDRRLPLREAPKAD